MSAQIEELLSSVDSKKLSAVVGGLESQLESIKRSSDPRPSSVGNTILQHQEPPHAVMMQQQTTHSQPVTLQYVSPATHGNAFQHSTVSNVVIATQPRVVGGPRHPQSQQLPVTFIQGGMIPNHNIQSQGVQQVAVNSSIQRLPLGTTVTTGNGNRPMLITSFPQNLSSNAVFLNNGQQIQQILFLPRPPLQSTNPPSQQPIVAVPRTIAPSNIVKQQPVAPSIQQQPTPPQPQALQNIDDMANRGRKFLADLVAIATKQNPEAGNKISRLIDEVKNGQKAAATFVNDVQNMFPIVVRTGDESQSQIDQSTLVMMVHAAIAPGQMTSRSSTPQTVRTATAQQVQQANLMQHQQQLQQQQQQQMQQSGLSQVRIQGGIVQQQSAVLVSGTSRAPIAVQQQIGLQATGQSVLASGVVAGAPGPSQLQVRPQLVRTVSQGAMPPQQQQQQQPPLPIQPQRPASSAQAQRQRAIKMEAFHEPELMDVAAMSGVDLAEESRTILANSAQSSFNPPSSNATPTASFSAAVAPRFGGTTQSPPRMSREQPMLAPSGTPRPPTGSVVARLQHIVASNGLSLPPASSQSGANEPATALVNLLALATQSYLKDFVEQMAVVCAHRLYNLKTDSTRYEQIGDMRIQLRAIEKVEQKMMHQCLSGGMRSGTTNPAASDATGNTEETNAAVTAALGQSRMAAMAVDSAGKSVDQESARQREANATALAAIGGASRRWLSKKSAADVTAPLSASTPPPAVSEDSSAPPSESAGRAGQQAQRARRATLADVLFVLHQHPRLSRHPTLIYKYTNISGK